MRFWQKGMINLALNPKVKFFMQTNRSASVFARQFVGARDEDQVIKKSEQLIKKGIRVSFFHLGEYVKNKKKILKTIHSLSCLIKSVGQTDLDNQISIDPTQAGLLHSFSSCRDNLMKLARTIKEKTADSLNGEHFLMLDMEDASVTDDTISLCACLADCGLPVAITFQACLFRTPLDIDLLSGQVKAIRLVKGAFAESSDICLTRKNEIDQQYLCIAKRMMDNIELNHNFCPVFATHDDRLIGLINAYAAKNDIPKDRYEFEMLYGVRTKLQGTLAQNNFKIRVYLPYGKDFWPYAVRRVGENPKNIKFLLKSVLR